MVHFEPSSFGPQIEPLVNLDRRCSLGPGKSRESQRSALESLTVERAFAHVQVNDVEMARACLAGVWLLHDFLDRSHRLSQAITTPTGSYWHGIMHRREGDFPNAKYWFERVGEHPVYPLLVAPIQARLVNVQLPAGMEPLLVDGQWNPYAMVDACAASQSGQASYELCLDVQQWEWELLFNFSYECAVG